MPQLQYSKPEKINLKLNPNFNEKWVQELIANDPSIIGLGELRLIKFEKIQPSAGRLDLLFEDDQQDKRYEVEIQLGKTDESHIIRTIEYWDNERKRYPEYEHCAVIIAEDITTRFLNVISLFNGHIPIIAIQMNAVKIEDKFSIVFTKILDEVPRSREEEDENLPLVNREYWYNKVPDTLNLADKILEIIKTISPGIEFKYNKGYITLTENNLLNRFINFFPMKNHLVITIRYPRDEEIISKLEESEINFHKYNKKGRYRIILKNGDIEKNQNILYWLFKLAYENSKLD